jgi:hypothetical protein
MADTLRARPYRLVARSRKRKPPCAPPAIVWLERFSLRDDGQVGTSIGASSVHPPVRPPRPAISWASDADAGATRNSRVLWTVAEVPPGYVVTDVRVGLGTGSETFVGEITLAPINGLATTAVVLLADDPEGTDLGPLFVDSAPAADPAWRPTLLCLRLDVARTDGRVVLGGLRLCLAPI